MNKEQKERAEALRLFDQGTPVAIEDEALRGYLQGHRWGYHGERGQASPYCPACERQRDLQKKA